MHVGLAPSPDDPLELAFELAFFVLRDRDLALRSATEALARLEVAALAQDRRRYYTPGRKDVPPRRTRVSLNELQLLQRLLYHETETHELAQERAGADVRRDDLVVRFVKHLVRITLCRNAFHVTLGLGRLLHTYSTEDVMTMYELLVQDPDLVKGEVYCRARKRRLLAEIRERFGPLVSVVRRPNGEQRLAALDDPGPFVDLVDDCLRRFTPWHTPCPVPDAFAESHEPLDALRFAGDHPDDEHGVEVRRIHAVLHPPCFARLLAALGLDRPERRLAIPDFHVAASAEDPPDDRRRPPPLGAAERRAVDGELERRAVSSPDV